MKFGQIFLTIAVSFAVSIAVSAYISPYKSGAEQSAAKESTYDRVMRTRILRCGYFEEAPFTIVDPNTGNKSGIAVELAEKIASDFSLKLEWAAVANFSTLAEDLKMGRYDAICASLFNLPRAGSTDYTIPYTYVPVYAYTQNGRTEFDNKFDQIDWSKISIAGLDGEGSTTIAQKKLPEAKFVILPQTSQIADMLTSVVDRKADMGFVMPTVFQNFDLNNPHKLQKIVTDKPFYVFNLSFGVKPDEAAFKNMLDFEIRSLSTNGFLQDLFKKYDPGGLLFRPADLYKAAQ